MQSSEALTLYVKHMHPGGKFEDEHTYKQYNKTYFLTTKVEHIKSAADIIYVALHKGDNVDQLVLNIADNWRIIIFNQVGEKINHISGAVCKNMSAEQKKEYIGAILANL